MRTAASILIVDDDQRLRRLLSRFLLREGYQVCEAGDADEMRRALIVRDIDLVLLDLMLPGEDGLTLAKELRTTSDVPIVMLTGKDSTIDKVVGLEIGADDYVTKPFDERELLARLRTVLRRSANRAGRVSEVSQGHVACFDKWRVDLLSNEVNHLNGEKVNMTGNEFQLLASFLAHPNRALSRQEILDILFNRNWSPSDRSIDVLIAKVRRKLGDNPRQPHLIKSIRGVGYKFTAKVEFI